jgi:hypothetical protein
MEKFAWDDFGNGMWRERLLRLQLAQTKDFMSCSETITARRLSYFEQKSAIPCTSKYNGALQ